MIICSRAWIKCVLNAVAPEKKEAKEVSAEEREREEKNIHRHHAEVELNCIRVL